MSISASGQQATPLRRRVEYTEQPFPSPDAAHAAHSNPSVNPATRSDTSVTLATTILPRRLPAPVEVLRRIGGRPLRPNFFEQVSAGPVHPHTCNSLDYAMVKALNAIEILEHICTFLPTRQVPSLQLVCKKWCSLVDESPRLVLHLFVEPLWSYPATEFRLIRLAASGLEIKRGDPVHWGQWVEVRMTLEAAQEIMAATKTTPKTGTRFFLLCSQDTFNCRRSTVRKPSRRPNLADLLITQPPLKGMQAFLVDTQGATLETAGPEDQPITVQTAHAKMSCDAGITLGFLAEVAEWMFEKHERLLQGEDHAEKVAVFKAIVSHCVQSDAAPRMRSATRTVTEIESLQ
jgi:hypothetical protein